MRTAATILSLLLILGQISSKGPICPYETVSTLLKLNTVLSHVAHIGPPTEDCIAPVTVMLAGRIGICHFLHAYLLPTLCRYCTEVLFGLYACPHPTRHTDTIR